MTLDFQYISNQVQNSKIKVGLIIILLLYFFSGIYPFAIFESDSIAIANACQHIINSAEFKEVHFGHSFHMQSGTYAIIVAISKLFTISTLASYSVLTAIFGISFFILTILFVGRIMQTNFYTLALLLLLFQEATSLACYPNSTAPAAAVWMAGFLILTYPKQYILKIIIAGVILSIAAWFRIEILFVYPSVLFLFLILGYGFKKCILYSGILLLLVVPLTYIAMYLSNARISGFLGYTEYSGMIFGYQNKLGIFDISIVRSHIAFFSILLLLFISLGFVLLIKNKNWRLILFCISGIIFYYLFGTGHYIAPKHLVSFTPFFLILITKGTELIRTSKYQGILVLISCILFIQYLVGIKLDIQSIPYANKSYSILNPEPSLIRFFHKSVNQKNIKSLTLQLGAGTKIPSQDEYLLSSGLVFNAPSWIIMKKKTLERSMALNHYLDTCSIPDLTILVTNGSSQMVINSLLNKGFIWDGDTTNKNEVLKFYNNNSQLITLERSTEYIKNNTESFYKIFREIGVDRYLVVFLWDWQVYMMEEYKLYSNKITYGVYEICNSSN